MVSDLLMPSKVTGFLKCLLRHKNQSRQEMCVAVVSASPHGYSLDFQQHSAFSEAEHGCSWTARGDEPPRTATKGVPRNCVSSFRLLGYRKGKLSTQSRSKAFQKNNDDEERLQACPKREVTLGHVVWAPRAPGGNWNHHSHTEKHGSLKHLLSLPGNWNPR